MRFVATTRRRDRNVFLFTDGWETKGEARSVLPLLAEKDLKIYPFAPPQVEILPKLVSVG